MENTKTILHELIEEYKEAYELGVITEKDLDDILFIINDQLYIEGIEALSYFELLSYIRA